MRGCVVLTLKKCFEKVRKLCGRYKALFHLQKVYVCLFVYLNIGLFFHFLFHGKIVCVCLFGPIHIFWLIFAKVVENDSL